MAQATDDNSPTDESKVLEDYRRYIEDYNAHDLNKILSHIDDKIQIFMAPELEVPASKGKNALRRTYGEDTRNKKSVKVCREPVVESSENGTVTLAVALQTRSTALDVLVSYRVEDLQQVRHVISNVRELEE